MKINCAVLVATVFALSVHSAAADPVIDQSLITGNAGVGSANMAQTFTVGIAGTLTGISLPISGSEPVFVEIRRTTSAASPGPVSDVSAILAQQVLTPAFAGGFGSSECTSVDFSS